MNDYEAEMLARVDALAAKMGVAADEVYRVLVRQAQVELVERLVMIIPLLLGWVFLCWLWKKHENTKGYSDEVLVVGLVVGFVCVGFFTVSVVIFWGDIPTLVLNPEYWALNEILSAFGK